MTVFFFGLLFVAILVGIPVAFAIAISALAFLILTDFPMPGVVVQRMVAGVDSFPLLALPMFILAGNLMAFGTTERLMRLAHALLGQIRGGLAMSGVVAATFFSSISGSGVATCAAVGAIVQPEMTKKGYPVGFSASLVAGAGSLGIVIPPSLPMVIFGVSASVSIGELFLAGIVPGLITALLFLVYCWGASRRQGYAPSELRPNPREFARIVADSLLPLLMPVLILGGILLGVFTPTEAAAVAVAYALILAMLVYRALTVRQLGQVLLSSAKSSAVILFVIAASAPFSWVMATERIPQLLSGMIVATASEPWAVLALMVAFMLFLGTFMETIAIIVIMTPIFMPLVHAIGMNPVHFGVVFTLALAIGGATPPLSVNLFVTARIAGISLERAFPYIIHVVLVMLVALLITAAVPAISTWPTGS